MMTKSVVLAILLCGTCQSLPQVRDPNIVMERLKRLDLNDQQNHFELVNQTIRELNNRPSEATEAALQILEALNREEEKSLKQPCDQESGIKFIFDRTLAGKNPFLKADLFEIVVRLRQIVPPSLQQHSLRVMAESFTPSTYDELSIQLLTTALLRMGKQAVPVILQLARNCSETVRTVAASRLGEISKVNGNELSVRCDEVNEQCKRDLENWTNWWSIHSGNAMFPCPPSVYSAAQNIRH